MNRGKLQICLSPFVVFLLTVMVAGCGGNTDSVVNNPKSAAKDDSETIPKDWNEDQRSVYRTNAAESLIEKLVAQLSPLKNRLSGSSDDLSRLFVEGFDYIGPGKFSVVCRVRDSNGHMLICRLGGLFMHAPLTSVLVKIVFYRQSSTSCVSCPTSLQVFKLPQPDPTENACHTVLHTE